MHSDLEARFDAILAAAKAAAVDSARSYRAPSMAKAIGLGSSLDDYDGPDSEFAGKAAKLLRDRFGKNRYRPGTLITALLDAGERDVELQLRGKASLQSLGIQRADAPGYGAISFGGKATLGTTGTTGGYVLPNNLVDSVTKPQTMEAFWPSLVKVRSGINVRAVDQPYRLGPAARATFQDWGQTKQNLSETYGSYTATLGTLALIYDQGKQYARFSAGAAELDVMDELGRGFALAENYAILAGPGTGASTPGVSDPTLGIYTGLASVVGTLTALQTTVQTPSVSTIAGSAAKGFADAIGAMQKRSRMPTAFVTDATTFGTIIGEGTDTAGFFVSPTGGPTGFRIGDNGTVTFWGIPLFWDANFDTYTGTTKKAIALDGSAFTLYRGLEFRIDTSDVAGTRWDQNLIGYRGEEEIGFNALPGIYNGGAQLISAVIP